MASAGPYANHLHLAPGISLLNSIFYRPDALPCAQPTVLKHWRQLLVRYSIFRTLTAGLGRQVKTCASGQVTGQKFSHGPICGRSPPTPHSQTHKTHHWWHKLKLWWIMQRRLRRVLSPEQSTGSTVAWVILLLPILWWIKVCDTAPA